MAKEREREEENEMKGGDVGSGYDCILHICRTGVWKLLQFSEPPIMCPAFSWILNSHYSLAR